jgi:hypothetical protein
MLAKRSHFAGQHGAYVYTQEEIDEIRFFLDYTEMKINKNGVDVDAYNKQRINELNGGC